MKADSRTRLLQAAEKTAYLYGFGSASIADIAKEARIPLGNVYYYFKTKDDIGNAIIELRVSRFKKLLRELGKADSPKQRLCGFVDIKIKTVKHWHAVAVPLEPCVPNYKNTVDRPQGNRGCYSRKP